MRNFKFPILLVGVIFYFANESFNFGSFWRDEGKFNIADVGNLLVWLGVGYLIVVKNGAAKIPKSPLTFLILVYLIVVLLQIALAGFFYGQTFWGGLIGSRHQFYYMSFFLFVMLLDRPERVVATLNLLVVLALAALALGLVNYFGTTILSHEWAEGHGVRAGIVRAYIPAMPILSIAFGWVLAVWFTRPAKNLLSGFLVLVLFAAHVFRQSRMRLFGTLVYVTWDALIAKRFVSLVTMGVLVVVLASVVSSLYSDENVLLAQFTSLAEDYKEGRGSWSGRLEQVEIAVDEFMEHPLLGSGASTLRMEGASSPAANIREWKNLALKSDLGYLSWIKAYGLIGVIWFVWFFGYLFFTARRYYRQLERDDGLLYSVSMFCYSSVVFLLTTFVTLNHLMFPSGILLVCLVAAITVRLKEFNSAS